MSHTAAAVEAEEPNGTSGTWAVVVSAFAVLATAVASMVFFQGFLGVLKLPGEMPPMNQIPHTEQTARPLLLMRLGTIGFVLAAILALVGFVAGVVLARRPDSFRRGVWALALAACTPFLALMLLTGMGAN